MDRSELESLLGGSIPTDRRSILAGDSIQIPARKPGPLLQVQYVIEIVGPKTVPATAASQLLSDTWRKALGQAQMYAMTSADTAWRPLAAPASGSFDSIALAWDYLSAKGSLSKTSAEVLLRQASSFAQSVQRLAMPLPTPDQVDVRVRELSTMRESLDIGFEIGVISAHGSIRERDVWRACMSLGMDLDSDGSFVWRHSGWQLPLLSVASWEEGKAFRLSGVKKDEGHQAIGVGFNVPTSPDPEAVFDRVFEVADLIAKECGAIVTDDAGKPYDSRMLERDRSDLDQARKALASNGLMPGSAEALKLFSQD